MKQGAFTVSHLNVVFHVIDKSGRFYLLEHNTKGEDCIVCYDVQKNIYCHTRDSLATVMEHPLDYVWYSVSQLIELNGLEPEEAIELDEANKIDPSMSTKDIREVVKEYKKQREQEDADEETEETEEPEETEETEEQEEVDRTMLAIKDIADNIDIALSDERFKKSDKDKFEDFKNWILSIEL